MTGGTECHPLPITQGARIVLSRKKLTIVCSHDNRRRVACGGCEKKEKRKNVVGPPNVLTSVRVDHHFSARRSPPPPPPSPHTHGPLPTRKAWDKARSWGMERGVWHEVLTFLSHAPHLLPLPPKNKAPTTLLERFLCRNCCRWRGSNPRPWDCTYADRGPTRGWKGGGIGGRKRMASPQFTCIPTPPLKEQL